MRARDYPITCGMIFPAGFWFRVCGYGLHIKKARDHVPLFSERNGYRVVGYAFGMRFELLKP